MEEQQDKLKGRVLSIDALRGFDMFWIIGGALILRSFDEIFDNDVTEFICTQLTHVKWEGFRFEDLIFPLFLFIVGLVMPFSIAKRVERGQSRARLLVHIFRRGAILFFLGLLYNGFMNFEFEDFRWTGVLQRIGLCYTAAAVIVVFTKWRVQAGITAGILLLYWAALKLIPVPGFGAGVITPEGCLTSYVDQLLLPGKLWYVYGDNEGLLSMLTATATTLLGVLAGHWLRTDRSGLKKAAGLAGAGVVCLVIGYLWWLVFPVVKLIWTSSYVMVAGGWSLLLLALFYLVIDVWGFKKWAFFFVVIGANAITIYCLQVIVNFGGMAKFFLGGVMTMAGSASALVFAVGLIAVKWLFLWWLYRHRMFFKV
jgi:predicted acyltransferase